MTVEPLEPRTLLAATPPAAPGLTLVNADTDRPLPNIKLTDGVTLDLAKLGRRLSIRADVPPTAASVRFNYDGDPGYFVDPAAPFAIAGNADADYLPWTPTVGTHTLIVTPYDAANVPGHGRAVTFTVVDSSPAQAAVRVNAGGPAFTTAAGLKFNADAGFTGGQRKTVGFDVAGTADDPLYQSMRTGRAFKFSTKVADGLYTLTLRFLEPYFQTPGGRAFDVTAEGQRVLRNYDIAADAGPRAAATKPFTVTVTDGHLDLAFAGVKGDAVVSAIELTPQFAGPAVAPAVPAPLRVNAGGGAFTDLLARTFDADSGFTGGRRSDNVYDIENLNPRDARLFSTYRVGRQFSFSRPVANGRYAVWVEFAEPTFTAAGKRTFDVRAEGALVLDDYDVFKQAGGRRFAVADNFDVEVADNALDLAFMGVSGDAIVSAIVALPTDIPAAAAPYEHRGYFTPGTPLGDAANTANLVRSASNLRRIGQAMFLYSNEHKGRFPATIAPLAEYEPGHDAFANPRTTTGVPRGESTSTEDFARAAYLNDYVYLGKGLNNTAPAERPLAYENPDRVVGRICVLFGDGHVEGMDRAAAAALLRFPDAEPTHAPEPRDPFDPARVPALDVVESQRNLRLIGQALQLHANEHRGRYPATLGVAYRTQDIDLATFVNPRAPTTIPQGLATREAGAAWIDASGGYLYADAGKVPYFDTVERVLAYENPAALAGGINLLFIDGRVEFREMSWAMETIGRSAAPLPF